jgi:type II secretory pathway component PulM
MLSKVDPLVESLQQKEKELAEMRSMEGRSEEEMIRDNENLVSMPQYFPSPSPLMIRQNKLERLSLNVSRVDQ